MWLLRFGRVGGSVGRLWGLGCRLLGLGLHGWLLCGRVVVVHARFFDRFMWRLRSCAFYIGLPPVRCFHQAGGFLYPFIGVGGWGFACFLGCV